jgi:hypothetical protein
MNDEPVGVVCEFEGILVGTLFEQLPDGTPLYTHPAKTLTEDTECQYCKQGCIRCDARKLLTDEEIKAVYGEYFDIENCDWLHLECIRAILRKAQEK